MSYKDKGRTCPICDETKLESEFYRMDWMCKNCKKNKNKETYWRKKSASYKAEEMVEELSKRIQTLELLVEALQGELKQVKRDQTKGFKVVNKNMETLNEENMAVAKSIIKKAVNKEIKKHLKEASD